MENELKLGVTILGEFHDVAQVEPENCLDIYTIYNNTIRFGWFERWNDGTKELAKEGFNSVAWFLYYALQDEQDDCGVAIEVPFEEIKFWTHFLRVEDFIE